MCLFSETEDRGVVPVRITPFQRTVSILSASISFGGRVSGDHNNCSASEEQFATEQDNEHSYIVTMCDNDGDRAPEVDEEERTKGS
jgi:hypothetical protein